MDLRNFFEKRPSGALAFSGGTDSSLLVWAAAKYGKNWRAYYVRSPFQPAFELDDARTVAAECGLPLTIIDIDILKYPEVAANTAKRCYYCKRELFSALKSKAFADGLELLIDGTNASDNADDRPGMKALGELGVISPLRECGLTKDDVRALCRKASLPIWNKPSYACLATRIPCGTRITREALRKVERGEAVLRDIGFRDFRIRLRGESALLEFAEDELSIARARFAEIRKLLAPIFSDITLDPVPR